MPKLDKASDTLIKVIGVLLSNQEICKYLAYPTDENPLSKPDVVDPVRDFYRKNIIQPDMFIDTTVQEKGIFIRVFPDKFRFEGTTEYGRIGIHIIYTKDSNVTFSEYNGVYKNKPLEVCYHVIDAIESSDDLGYGFSVDPIEIEHMGYDDKHACYQMVIEKLESRSRGR